MKKFLAILFIFLLGLGILFLYRTSIFRTRIVGFSEKPSLSMVNPKKAERAESGLPGRDFETMFKDDSQKMLAQFTLEQKVGQLFIIGFDGKKVNKELENLMEKIQPGGVLLLEKNIEDQKQLEKLIDDLQAISIRNTGLPLFIAVDQEGGKICRIEFLDCPVISEIQNKKQAFETGFRMGEDLRKLGVNLNLAPVLDQSAKNDFIFRRTFQKDLVQTGNLAKFFIQGQKTGGIFTALKHFPGYGGIDFDPETERLAVFSQVPEISQFQTAMAVKPKMVMTSNAVYLSIDNVLPFSLSPKGIKFLREKLGKEVLIISDDLASPVLKRGFSLERTILLAQKAGLDILLVSNFWNRLAPIEAFNTLLQATKASRALEREIEERALRIIKLKQRRFEPDL